MNIKRKIATDLLSYQGSIKTDAQLTSTKDFSEDLKYLDFKLSHITRDVGVLDICNIAGSVEDASLVNSAVAGLSPNTGLVINVTTQDYSKGDIVVKKDNGEIITIKAEAQGLYYPSAVATAGSGTGQYQITYSFSSTLPAKETDTITVNGTSISKPAKQITVSGFTLGQGSKAISYNVNEDDITTDNITFDALSGNGTDYIFPVIKCYSENGELVETEITVVLAGNEYTVSNIPSIVKKLVAR